MEIVLETNHLEKKYKNFTALNHLNIQIEKGAIYGLIGKNGSGKTTLIRIICGLQEPTQGSYTIYGENNNSGNISLVRRRIGAIIEMPSIYGEMNARDNLIQQYKLVGMPSLEGIDELLQLVGLENTGNKKAKNFSLGMKQRLGIAIALANHPDFLILDEPINGLDPQGIIEMRELILKLNKEKRMTILISSHYLDELSKVATHYGFLDKGSIIEEISHEKLMKKLNHKIELKVSHLKEFVNYFEAHKISYDVVDPQTIVIYGKWQLASLINDLIKHQLIADDVRMIEESLENYYLNLVEGAKHD